MNLLKQNILICVAMIVCLTTSTDWSSLDALFESAITDRTFPGGIVSIATSKTTIYQKAYGTFTYANDLFTGPAINLETQYDIASLTKVTATLSAIVNLYEQKHLNVDDLVIKYIPQYNNNNKEQTKVRNLLLHNAGLPDDAPDINSTSKDSVMKYIYTCKLQNPVGTAFQYSDLSFILLAQIVQRITKQDLQTYVHQIFNNKMTLKDTNFKPNQSSKPKIPPTQFKKVRGLVQGVVHDPTCYTFGGVAGHAGIFSTIRDLTRYMRIWLNNGQIPGENRVFSKQTAAIFTKKQTGLNYQNTRALGWDTVPIQANPPCGHKFSNNSFGHTGFTGTSIWADKDKDLIISVLTNRVHPSSANNAHIKFRADVSDLIVDLLGY